MDYRYLRAFLETAKEASLSRAAENLNIATSAVSRQIGLLEESVGKQLFIRSPRKVILTPEGKELYAKAKELDRWLSESFADEKPKKVTIGAMQGIMEHWLADALAEYYAQQDISLDLVVGKAEELIAGLEEARFDFTITYLSPNTELVSSSMLFQQKLALVSKSGIDLKKLSDERWVIYDRPDYMLRYSKNMSRNVIRVNSITAMLKFIEKGLGVTIMASHMIDPRHKVSVKMLPPSKVDAMYLNVLNTDKFPSHVQGVIQALKSHAKAYRVAP